MSLLLSIFLFRQVREEVGDVNILVNNAGIMVIKKLLVVFLFFFPQVIKQLLQHSNSEVQDTMDVSFFIFYEFSLRGKNRHLDRIFCCELIGYDWIGTRDGHADIFGDAHRCVCRIA